MILFALMTVVGWSLVIWAGTVNPRGARRMPEPLPVGVEEVQSGPYRWLTHPMYVGNWLAITGMAGLAAGFWNAFAVGTLAELLLRDWANREKA